MKSIILIGILSISVQSEDTLRTSRKQDNDSLIENQTKPRKNKKRFSHSYEALKKYNASEDSASHDEETKKARQTETGEKASEKSEKDTLYAPGGENQTEGTGGVGGVGEATHEHGVIHEPWNPCDTSNHKCIEDTGQGG